MIRELGLTQGVKMGMRRVYTGVDHGELSDNQPDIPNSVG